MNYNEIHVIKGEGINVVYHYKTFTMMVVKDEVCQILEALKRGYSVIQISKEAKYSENDVMSVIQFIEEKISKNENYLPQQNSNNNRVIDRITLHVSNDCNLRCRYCYALGGNYNQDRAFMNKQTANDFVDFCINHFDQINRIVFFGGEPMLNIEIMKYICNLFKNNFSSGRLSQMPEFGIITNGTILNPEIISFLKENITSLTVSIDGPKDINDENRVYSNGKGSYETIKQFIKTVKSETKIPIIYEATYTRQHIEKQYKSKDIHNFMLNEFGIKGVIVEEESLEINRILDYWQNYDYKMIAENNFENMPIGFWSILKSIAGKQSRKICPVMKRIFSISSNGYIFPCHMLAGNTNNNLGNIKAQNFFNQRTLYKSSEFIIDLQDNPKCNGCWCQYLCGGCAVHQFYNKQQKKFQKKPNSELCEINKQHIAQIILMIAALRQEPLYWEKLMAKAKERQMQL